MFARILPLFRCPSPSHPLRALSTQPILLNKPSRIDYSRVPVLDENDLEEDFMRGSGPGGQAVAKTNNCVMLRHKPTNIIVKCHLTRSLQQNRKEARHLLVMKLDNQINGEHSVENQKKRRDDQKSASRSSKRAKLEEMKRQWKERESIGGEGSDDNTKTPHE